MKNSKEELRKLIETIKNLTGATQEEISIAAGYKPKSLTQLLSKFDGHESAITRIRMAYSEALKDSTKVEMIAGNKSSGEELAKEKDLRKIIELQDRMLKEKDRTLDIFQGIVELLISNQAYHMVEAKYLMELHPFYAGLPEEERRAKLQEDQSLVRRELQRIVAGQKFS